MVDNKKNRKRQYAASEALYDLNGDQSVKIIHERNDHRYVGLLRVAALDLSKKARKKVEYLEYSEDEEDDMSETSNLSREALIDLIRKHNNNKMGSYSKNNPNKLHPMPSELGDEESSSDSSALNSSSNSSVERWFRQDAADKG